MKKRILALALAGTTAFSVFGSAISANAYYPSTDIDSQVDAYVSYTPVAKTINIKADVDASTKTVYYHDYNKVVTRYESLAELKAALANNPDIQSNYTTYTCVADNFYVSSDYTKIIGTNAGGLTGGDVVGLTANDASGNPYYEVLQIKASKEVPGSYVYDEQLYDNLEKAVKAVREATYGETSAPNLYILNVDEDTRKDAENYAKLYLDIDTYIAKSNTVTSKPETVPGSDYNAIAVNKNITAATDTNYTEWTFNSDMTGDATVYPFEVTSKLVQSGTTIYVESTKEETPTIYAYDFIPETIPASSVTNVAANWNAEKLAETVDALGVEAMQAEDGPGSQYSGSIRYEVVTEWEEFLEELSLDKYWLGHGLGQFGFDEFCKNYKDMFYNDPQFDKDTGLPADPEKVDLYNITGLLEDIWELRTAEEWKLGGSTGYYNANTSELIYLMQQYDKYIGEYIDKTEVTTDEWGDLLLSILDAATEENFKDANTYRRYQNQVENLRVAYETATTVTLIEKAERGMYDLLTSGNSKYTASKTTAVDKTALGDTMEGLYFNVGSIPAEYSTAPSTLTTKASEVDYTNYNYLVAAVTSGSAAWDNNLYFGSRLSTGYYSLYPAYDYAQSNNTAVQFAGNDVRDNYAANYGVSVTDEYEWFLNVYELATNMNADNNKQGSIDAVNDALADAVAELAVTTTPNSVELGAVEDALDKYAGKIESDYAEGYYNKYVQANDYAENVAEGKWQTRIAAMVAGVAGEALTYQGTQVTVTKNDMKTLEAAIKNGETALEAIKADKDYNAAQVNALNKAIDEAEYLVSLYEGTVSRNNPDVQSVNHVYSKLVGDKDQMVKSDLTAAIEAIDAAINYSEVKLGWTETENGWQYGYEKEDGTAAYVESGWYRIKNSWFYFEKGFAVESDWRQIDGKWYYLNPSCAAAYGWTKVDGDWYYFNQDNSMKTGWLKSAGHWYYLAPSGKMATGWAQVDGKWYYFSKTENAIGQMLANTTTPDGCKVDENGVWVK